MRITDLNLRNETGVLRAEAQVIWEDVERPPFRLFIETDERHADAFRLDPNALLTACIVFVMAVMRVFKVSLGDIAQR